MKTIWTSRLRTDRSSFAAHDKGARWTRLFVVSAAIFVCGCAERSAPPPSSNVQQVSTENKPVTAAHCAECHGDIVASYATSGMSHSWRSTVALATPALPLPYLVEDRVTGYRYEMTLRDGSLSQIETYPGDANHRRERGAYYAVGSGHHAIAWVASENDFLTELPVGWFGKSGWRMNPGYELKNHRFSRPITIGCVACHATSATMDSPATNRFTAVTDGIDCTRCHGDATAHVAFWKSPNAETSPPKAHLLHPGQLPPNRANDLCLQCHLQGDVTVFFNQQSPLDFHPGQRLRDQRHDFLIANQPDSLGIASHGARMLQSRCYIASGKELTCIHCHDPHQPAASFSSAQYDSKCLTCHQPESCNRPATADERKSTEGCIACHMPQCPTREGLHLAFTDHAIRRRPAAMKDDKPTILAANAQVELVSAWPNAKPDNTTLGAAYVLLHETMGPQLPSLQRGYDLLNQSTIAGPADVSTRYYLGSAALALNHPIEAREHFRQVITSEPTHHQARYRLALAEEAAGNTKIAIELYERLLTDAPTWPEPHTRLAQLYLSAQKPTDARRILQKLVSLEPTAPTTASLALAERLSGATLEQALAKANAALELDARDPTVYITRATLHLLANHQDAARHDFERALHLDPTNPTIRQALGALSGKSHGAAR